MEELEEELKKVDLITLLRTFKKEGLDNFIVIRKEKLENNFIPKLKVKEKIEELEEYVKDFEEYWSKDIRKFKKEKCIDYYKLEALQELLREE